MFRVFFGALIAVSTITVGQANVLVTIDKSSQQMTVAVDGKERWAWPVSTGRGGYATPSGSFTPFRLEKDHFSEEWDEAPMPHSIFFTTKGHAIHGTFDKRRLGSPASHGCVRLAPENAAKLFALVKDRVSPTQRWWSPTANLGGLKRNPFSQSISRLRSHSRTSFTSRRPRPFEYTIDPCGPDRHHG